MLLWTGRLFIRCNIRFLTGALDCATSRTVWFEKKDLTPALVSDHRLMLRPFISPVVQFNNYDLLDGGVSRPHSH